MLSIFSFGEWSEPYIRIRGICLRRRGAESPHWRLISAAESAPQNYTGMTAPLKSIFPLRCGYDNGRLPLPVAI